MENSSQVSFTEGSLRESAAGDVLLRVAACCMCPWVGVGLPAPLQIARLAHQLWCPSQQLQRPRIQ